MSKLKYIVEQDRTTRVFLLKGIAIFSLKTHLSELETKIFVLCALTCIEDDSNSTMSAATLDTFFAL